MKLLNSKESIWIALWIFLPLILVSKKSKNKNIERWLFFMIIWIITAVISGLSVKYASIYEVNILLVTVFSLFFQFLGSFILFKINTKKAHNLSKIKRIWIFTWVLNFAAFYLFILAVKLSGSLWLIYVLQSLYIVIPIILSIIIYKEHFDFKKLIANVLTLASIYFMK